MTMADIVHVIIALGMNHPIKKTPLNF